MRSALLAMLYFLVCPGSTFAEVTSVTVTSRAIVADGKTFGTTGAYETLIGRIEFALDPADVHNTGIVDLAFAPRGADGKVHFSSSFYVLRPGEPAKGNGVLLFEIANRGRAPSLLGLFNRGGRAADPANAVDLGDGSLTGLGDGLLMREGYTLVCIGWQFDVSPPLYRVDAPPALLPAAMRVDPLSVDLIVNAATDEAALIDDPVRPPVIYPPSELMNPADRMMVRDHFWDDGVVVPRQRWRFISAPNGIPRVKLDSGFEPGRYYRVTYQATAPVVAGVGLAAIRDAAAAFRYRTDLPIHGRTAYVFGQSQTGRFLRQFLFDGFNVDERDRRVFDAMWIHIAGAARGSFNERFAAPGHGDAYRPTTFPFADADERDVDGKRGGLQSRYRPDQRAKVFYTNTPVEYWGMGRAAALIHTSVDGTRDLALPGNVRVYVLAGTQHLVAPFPPRPPAGGDRPGPTGPSERNDGQQASNPTPQVNVLRGLLRAWHQWAADGTAPPASRYPRLSDKTLVALRDYQFPALPGVADPRRIVGPARIINGKVVPLPFLVPQVDADGNELGGIRDPDVAVPLATTTGWNYRREAIGNPTELYQTLGSYIPIARTRAEREGHGDPRPSIEERYRGLDDYVQQVRAAATTLIQGRYMLPEDLEGVVTRATEHWAFATGNRSSSGGDR